MCFKVSLRKRCASIITLILFLALKLSLSFPVITSSSSCVGARRHHNRPDEIKLYLQNKNDAKVNTSIDDNEVVEEKYTLAPILSTIVAISVAVVFHNDPSHAMMNNNDSIHIQTQVPVVSFLNTRPAPTLHYRLPPSSVKDVIVEENKRIAQQMKEVQDRDGLSTITNVIEEEDERISQQMQQVGITTRIDVGIRGADVTVNDVRDESQRIIQQNSKSVPTSNSYDRTTQQPSRQQIMKGAGDTSTSKPDAQQKTQTNALPPAEKTESKELQTSDIEKIAAKNTIEVELKDAKASAAVIKIDRDNFTKVRVVQPAFLRYLPSSVQPLISSQFKSVQVLKSIPDDQLFIASVVAGSLTEVIRTTLLYPLSTVKARVQARSLRTTNRKRNLSRKLKVTWLTFLYETKKGELYSGIIPSLLITVPASGVYAGTKEVSRRAFTMAIPFFHNALPHDENVSTVYSALVVSLLAAFVADIAALALRTPADVSDCRCLETIMSSQT